MLFIRYYVLKENGKLNHKQKNKIKEIFLMNLYVGIHTHIHIYTGATGAYFP